MASKRNDKKPADPTILERGKITPISRVNISSLNRPDPATQTVVHRVYALVFEDGPWPIYQPVVIMPDGTEHLLLDGAFGPVSFVSLEHFRTYCLIGGYEIIDAPDDDDVESE